MNDNKLYKKLIEIIYGLSVLTVVVFAFALLSFALTAHLPDYLGQSIVIFIVGVVLLFWTRTKLNK